MKFKIFTMLGILLLAGLVFAGSGDTVDIPDVTLVYPTQLSTVEPTQPVGTTTALLSFICSDEIPSNDLDSHQVNTTLYYNVTENINHTVFNDTQVNLDMIEIETVAIGNGTSNTTTFTPILLTGEEYVTWNCLVCNYDGNCSWAATNYSFILDVNHDATGGSALVSYPTTSSVINTARASTQINFTATDDIHIQNVTLYFNFSSTDLLLDHVLNTNITFIENSTITNDGTTTGFISNTANTTLTGNFSDFNEEGDGFYYVQIRTCDYNGNCEISQNISFEWDATAPHTTEVSLAHTPYTCNGYLLNFNVTEASDYVIKYGVNESNLDQTISGSTFSNASMSINLTNVREYGETYYVNMTICDEHNNCNYSATLDGTTYKSFTKEVGICPGWQAYGLMNTSVTMGGIAVAENSRVITTVSWWNETNQTFINHIAGLSANSAHEIKRGDGYMVYANDSDYFLLGASTVFNITADAALAGNDGNFTVNISGNSGGNWTHFGLLQDWKMYNISDTLDNETYFSYYNNSLQKYVDHIEGWLWNNQTQMEAGETIWVWGNVYNYQWYRNETQVAD